MIVSVGLTPISLPFGHPASAPETAGSAFERRSRRERHVPVLDLAVGHNRRLGHRHSRTQFCPGALLRLSLENTPQWEEEGRPRIVLHATMRGEVFT